MNTMTGIHRFETLQALIAALAANGERAELYEFRKRELKVWSFAELADCSGRLAAGLTQAGIERGSHAVLLSSNRPPWIIACFALFQTGAIPVPVDAQMAKRELKSVVEQSETKWIFTSAGLVKRIEEEGIHKDRTVVLLEDGDDHFQNWRSFLADSPLEPRQVESDNRAVLFFTSGTSGKPKGVPLSHRNLTANFGALLDLDLIREDDRVLLPLLLHHIYPFVVGMLAPFAAGIPIVLPYSLTGLQLQRALRESGATAVVGVPRFYAAFYASIQNQVERRSRLLAAAFRGALALSARMPRYLRLPFGQCIFAPVRRAVAPNLRLLASGGSALDPAIARRLEGLGWQVASGYGLTETSPILTFNVPDRGRMDTAGRPLRGVEIRIGEAENDAPHGEVLAKGPNVFAGYHKMPGKSKEVFTPDGHFRTGDLGFFDRDGYLHLVGRASSMIVLPGGENVWPENVEEALERSETIREAGVFLKDDRLAAVIVVKPARMREFEEGEQDGALRAEIEERLRDLPSHHRIAEYSVVSEPLPRTRLGKIRRHKLVELHRQAKAGTRKSSETAKPVDIEEMSPEDRALLEDPSAKKVWDWLGQRFSDMRLAPDLGLQADLGIDSLDWMNLTLELRAHVGIDLDENAISRIQTVRDLIREAAEAEPAAEEDGRDMAQLMENPREQLSDRQRKWLEPSGPIERAFGAVLLRLNRLLMRGIYKIEIRGEGNLPQKRPFVLAPNHVSLLDPLAVSAALAPDLRSRIYWGGWTGIMFSNPVMRFISRAVHVVPVDPGGGPLSSLAFGKAALDAGHSVVWFPEGGRSKDGKLQRFRAGIGILSSSDSAPVIPVWIEGTFEALPPGKRWPRRSKISVTFGKPVGPQALAATEKRDEKVYQRIADSLHDRIRNLAQGAEDG